MTVKLMPFSEKYLPASRRWMNDKKICRLFNRVFKQLTAEVQKKWYENLIKDNTQSVFAIEVDGVYVGNVGLKFISPINHSAEFYIFIGDKKYWRKGVGTMATNKFLGYLKKNTKLHKIFLQVDETNLAARKLYVKTGFKEEGILTDEIKREGKYLTMIRLAYFLN